MRHTDPLYGLSELLAYLEGLKPSADRVDDARVALDYLKSRGFTLVHRAGPPVIRSAAPEDLKAARKALRVTNQRLAEEAGLSINAVMNAQKADALTRKRTVDVIMSTLVRLGANPPHDGEDEKLSDTA